MKKKRISQSGGSLLGEGGSEICFGLGLRGKRLTVGKNRSDSERDERWESKRRIRGNPTEIALCAGPRRAKEFRRANHMLDESHVNSLKRQKRQ